MNTKKFNQEMAGKNKIASLCHTVVSAIIAVAYIVEYIKGARTLGYALILTAVVLGAPIVEWIAYAREKDAERIKYIMGYGFAIFYAFAIFTSSNPFVFVYAVPLMITFSVYNNLKFSIGVNSCIILINILQGVKYIFFDENWSAEANLAELEIQILVMILAFAFTLVVTNSLEKNNKSKLEDINEKNRLVEELLNNTLEVSKGVTAGIEEIYTKVNDLNTSMDTTKDAMEQVSGGTNDTASAVQKQLEMTNDIQEKVADVQGGTEAIDQSIENMMTAIESGNENVKLLLSETTESKQIGKKVEDKLSNLSAIMEDMNMVVSMITDIASQTSLLALNASIEAARAGEAGKGFAVVASEISKMANDTEEATVKITDMIGSVTEAIVDVVSATGTMIEDIDVQNNTTSAAAKSFSEIAKDADVIKENSVKLKQVVDVLGMSNKVIVDSISTISSISEEVSAHASDVVDSSEANSQTVAGITSTVNELKALTDKLEQN